MRFEFSDRFIKMSVKLRDYRFFISFLETLAKVSTATNIQELPNCKKLVGHKDAFRLRIGDYRVGFFLVNDAVHFASVGQREGFYLSFP